MLFTGMRYMLNNVPHAHQLCDDLSGTAWGGQHTLTARGIPLKRGARCLCVCPWYSNSYQAVQSRARYTSQINIIRYTRAQRIEYSLYYYIIHIDAERPPMHMCTSRKHDYTNGTIAQAVSSGHICNSATAQCVNCMRPPCATCRVPPKAVRRCAQLAHHVNTHTNTHT